MSNNGCSADGIGSTDEERPDGGQHVFGRLTDDKGQTDVLQSTDVDRATDKQQSDADGWPLDIPVTTDICSWFRNRLMFFAILRTSLSSPVTPLRATFFEENIIP